MKKVQRSRGFGWIFLMALIGSAIKLTTAQENVLVITVNGTTEIREQCDSLDMLFHFTTLTISSSVLNSPCQCSMTSVSPTPEYFISKDSGTVPDPSAIPYVDTGFESSLPCVNSSSSIDVSDSLEFVLTTGEKDITQVFLLEDETNSCQLPITTTNGGSNLHLKCQMLASFDSAVDKHNRKPHKNVRIVVQTNITVYNNKTEDEPKAHVNSPLMHSRPTHNNVTIVVVICVLVGVIILAGSLILVSLVMHRKRLARRLAIHLRNLEEQGHPEAVPLTDTPDRQAEEHVKLVQLRRLDSSGCEFEQYRESGFQPVSPSDVGSVVMECDNNEETYLKGELSRSCSQRSSITNELFKSCDRAITEQKVIPERSISADHGSESGDSESFQDSIGDNLEQSLTGTDSNDSASNKEDKSVQTLNSDSYYQLFNSIIKIKLPKFRWRTKSGDSEPT